MKQNAQMKTERTIESDLALEVEQRYLAYALSTIVSRALPDVRDGLKPVHRRILYAMHAMGLHNTAKMRKSAAVVGEVIGKYHPHGDQAAYDALVRMAQDFSLRYPLIDGSGNFGSLDGDSPAAMRYTETRLSQFANLLLKEIEEGTTTFRPTYDAIGEEPTVLPAALPNLLLNGSSGIAVGMSCSFPPHNLGEVVSACRALMQNPRLEATGLMAYIKGPDFPTGGEVLDHQQSLAEIYRTGHGMVKLRGTYRIEKNPRGRTNIIVTSVPYTVNKSRLIERIASLIRDKKLRQVVDVRDESAQDVRIVLELKTTESSIESIMAFLYKHTELQINFPIHFIAITRDGIPERLGLPQILSQFLDFRYETVVSRLQHRLNLLLKRIHLLEGFEILFDDLDLALKMIRTAKSRQDAYDKLQETFPLDHEQTEAILDLRLYKLVGMEIGKVLEELAGKRKEAADIAKDLSSPERIWKIIDRELAEIGKRLGDVRRSEIIEQDQAVALDYKVEDLSEREDTTVILSEQGWIRRIKSRIEEGMSLKFRDGDGLFSYTRLDVGSTLAIFTNIGKVYVIRASSIPATTGFGEPLSNLLSLADGESVVGALTAKPSELYEDSDNSEDCETLAEEGCAEQQMLFDVNNAPFDLQDENKSRSGNRGILITAMGRGFRFDCDMLSEPSKRSGRKMVVLKPEDTVFSVVAERGPFVILGADSGHVLRFSVEQAPLMSGPAQGVQIIKLRKGAKIVAALCGRDTDPITITQQDETVHHLVVSQLPLLKRASAGKKQFPKMRSMELTPPQ